MNTSEEKASKRLFHLETWSLLTLTVQGPVSVSITQADIPPQG